MDKVKVAVFPCGTEVGLEIYRALHLEKNIELIGVSSNILNAGQIVYEDYRGDAPLFFKEDELCAYLDSIGADFIYPTNEQSIGIVSRNRHRIKTKLICHDPDTVLICESKRKTAEELKDLCPMMYHGLSESNYPQDGVFIKPDKGHSGIDGYACWKWKEFNFYFNPSTHVAFQLLHGNEYTIDCFTQDGLLKWALPRIRQNIIKGISGHSTSIDYKDDKGQQLMEIARKVNNKLRFNGAWFIQVKDGKVMEVGARIAGSSGLSRAMGVNLPLLNIYNALGVEINLNTIFPITEISRSLDVKAELPKEITEVVFDWDDTVSINGFINPTVMAFAWKMVQQGKRVFLLTRNTERKEFPEPFINAIRLPDKEILKSHYAADHVLLVDDSFEERKGWKYAISPSQIDIFL